MNSTVLTLSRSQKKKIGEKIKKMALAGPPSDAADHNFRRNHFSLRHTNCDALSQEQRGGCGGGGSATARRWQQPGGGAATVAASAVVAAAQQHDVGGGGSTPARRRRKLGGGTVAEATAVSATAWRQWQRLRR